MVHIDIKPSKEFGGKYELTMQNTDNNKKISILCDTKEQAFETIDNVPLILLEN